MLAFRSIVLGGAAVLLANCSSGSDTDRPDPTGSPDASSGADAAPRPDARPEETPTPDAAPPGAGCAQFATPAKTIAAYPSTVTGDTSTSEAILTVATCQAHDTPLGPPFEFAGPDDVIALTNLSQGDEYLIELTATNDVAYYLAVSCSGGDAVEFGECGHVVDSAGAVESGSFVAPGSEVFIVIDSETATAAGAYTLTVRQPECASVFDCTDAAKPVCENQACAAGPSECVADDGAENGNDGPAGATAITVPTAAPIQGKVCGQPLTEQDWFSFTLSASATLNFTLSWDEANADLELAVFDAAGEEMGASETLAEPEVAHASLGAGTYYVRVDKFNVVAASTAYSLTIQ